MRYRLVFSLAAALAAVVAVVAPASASITPIPEPTTLSLLAAGITGAIVAARFKGRK